MSKYRLLRLLTACGCLLGAIAWWTVGWFAFAYSTTEMSFSQAERLLFAGGLAGIGLYPLAMFIVLIWRFWRIDQG
jgi:hypothetical protein